MTASKETVYRDLVCHWTLACIEGDARAPSLRGELDGRAHELQRFFGLDALEGRILELAYGVERSFAAAQAARARGGLTVELLRELLADTAVDAALSPSRRLRRHALCAVAGQGMAAAADTLRLAPALAARLDGAPEPTGLWPGMLRLEPSAAEPVLPRLHAVAAALDDAVPRLVTLDGCAPRDALELAAALSARLGRPLLFVDGAALAESPDPALLLACARREADLDGNLLLVCEAAALGERWRAATAPPAPGATQSPLLIFADVSQTRAPLAVEPLTVQRHALSTPASEPLRAPAAADEQKDDGLDQIRRLAVRDAERALGLRRDPAAPIPPPRPAASASPPAPAPVPAPDPPPPAQAEAPKPRSRKAAQYFGGEHSEQPATAPPAPAPLPPLDPPVAAEGEPAPLPVPADAPPEVLARIAATSPSPSQRIELIRRLNGVRANFAIAALRANASSAHAGVRAAAEQVMAAMFGPNWNLTRPVPKPVQPPVSDENNER